MPFDHSVTNNSLFDTLEWLSKLSVPTSADLSKLCQRLVFKRESWISRGTWVYDVAVLHSANMSGSRWNANYRCLSKWGLGSNPTENLEYNHCGLNRTGSMPSKMHLILHWCGISAEPHPAASVWTCKRIPSFLFSFCWFQVTQSDKAPEKHKTWELDWPRDCLTNCKQEYTEVLYL